MSVNNLPTNDKSDSDDALCIIESIYAIPKQIPHTRSILNGFVINLSTLFIGL